MGRIGSGRFDRGDREERRADAVSPSPKGIPLNLNLSVFFSHCLHMLYVNLQLRKALKTVCLFQLFTDLACSPFLSFFVWVFDSFE